MKTLALIAAAGLLQATVQAQPFTLSGKVEGKQTGYVFLAYSPGGDNYKMDSARLLQGKFVFKGNIDGPSMANMFLDKPDQMSFGEDAASFFLEPGTLTTTTLKKGNLKAATLKGSKAQDDFDILNAARKEVITQLTPLSDRYNKLNLEYIAARKAKKDSATLAGMLDQLDKIKDDMEPFYEKQEAIDKDFIEKHPGSYVTAYLLRFRISSMPLQQGEAYYSKMPPALQKSGYGKEIRKELDGLRSGSPGSPAFVFSSTDINGQPLSLNDYKGKYVLVDFWASWCGPCRKGNPHLKALYAQYKDKGLEIIGISDDDSRPADWKKAVAQDGIGIWKHVLRGLNMEKRQRNEPNPEDISDKYGIHSLPTKILIDPNGMIIGRYGGGGEDDAAMDKKLQAVLGT